MDLFNIDEISIVVCSSGFMTYPIDILNYYKYIQQYIELDPFTFLLLPSLDLEICVKEIICRQVQRNYLNTSIQKEEEKIRKRFALYANLQCKKILTDRHIIYIVDELCQQLSLLMKNGNT